MIRKLIIDEMSMIYFLSPKCNIGAYEVKASCREVDAMLVISGKHCEFVTSS
jgi:hypothetical protein